MPTDRYPEWLLEDDLRSWSFKTYLPSIADVGVELFGQIERSWLAYEATYRTQSSLRYAIRILGEFCFLRREDGLLWKDVDDHVLSTYRAAKIESGFPVRSINRRVSVMFDHYAWAESARLISGHVQLDDARPVSPDEQRSAYRLTSRPDLRSSSGRASTLLLHDE